MRAERTIVPPAKMARWLGGENPGGLMPDREYVSYTFGVVSPIEFEEAYTANRGQLDLVLATMRRFLALVAEMSDAMGNA